MSGGATPTSLGELARLFLRLGATAFGGPAAHVALMEDEVVRRRAWLSREEFLDLMSATNLIPGPNSTELAIHIGRVRAGAAGLVVAGACFIAPAVALTLGAAWAYVRFGALPAVASVLAGVKPVMVAVVVQALLGLGRTALRGPLGAGVALASTAALVAGVHELVVLLTAGLGVAALRGARPGLVAGLLVPLAPAAAGAAAGAAAPGTLFLVFAKIGAVLFGSGYVLIAFLRADLVERRGWLSEAQLLDAVAVGQMTPGPLFSTATFVGYLLAGAPGALAATAGIFLPAFVLVALSGPLVPRLRASPATGAFLDGVNAASLALMAVVSVQLGRAALTDPLSVALALGSGVLLVRWHVASAWLVLGGGLAGLLRGLAG